MIALLSSFHQRPVEKGGMYIAFVCKYSEERGGGGVLLWQYKSSCTQNLHTYIFSPQEYILLGILLGDFIVHLSVFCILAILYTVLYGNIHSFNIKHFTHAYLLVLNIVCTQYERSVEKKFKTFKNTKYTVKKYIMLKI
jgi:hypothetical protein